MNDRRGQNEKKVCDSFFYFLFYIFDVTLLIEKITVTFYEKQTVYCICSFISVSVAVTRQKRFFVEKNHVIKVISGIHGMEKS